LIGSLPKEIGVIESLIAIKLFSNSIGGNLPRQIGYLKQLQILDLEKNKLSGRIDQDTIIGLASSLRQLRVSLNNLGGKIPNMSTFTNLEKLWLANNTFTGDFPESIVSLQGLGKLDNATIQTINFLSSVSCSNFLIYLISQCATAR
jgi:Leucine-rich repeat (LRR) protein